MKLKISQYAKMEGVKYRVLFRIELRKVNYK